MNRERSRSLGRCAAFVAFSVMVGAGVTARAAADTAEDEDHSAGAATEAAPAEAAPARAPAAPAEPTEPPPLAEGDHSAVEPPQPPPAGVPPIPATIVSTGQAPAPAVLSPYIEHLGPESFPGRLRGLYGGSLWLEPTFAGLQWPYMAHTGIGVSGWVWVNSGYETIKRSVDQIPNSRMYFQQGRGVLRLTPTFTQGNFFIQGQAELVGNLCQTADIANLVCHEGTFTTDDMWIRIGQWNRWDLKVGRFQGWEIYHLGMGMDRYSFERMGAGMFGLDTYTTPKLEAPAFYGVNNLQERPTDGLAAGYIALHLYASEYLRFELLGKLSTDNMLADNSTGDLPSTSLGGRPTAILDFGWLKFKVGAEYETRTPTTQAVQPGMPGHKVDAVAERDRKGAGASLQFVIDPIVEFGVNAAIGNQLLKNGFGQQVPEGSFTTTSVGGFLNVRAAPLWLVGLGVNWTSQTDKFVAANSSVNDYTSHLQGFGALQYLLGGQLFIKGVFGFAQAYFQPSDTGAATWRNNMYSGRVQLMYLY